VDAGEASQRRETSARRRTLNDRHSRLRITFMDKNVIISPATDESVGDRCYSCCLSKSRGGDALPHAVGNRRRGIGRLD